MGVIKGDVGREELVAGNRQRLREEVRDVLQAWNVFDDELALPHAIPQPVKPHDLDILGVKVSEARPIAHSLSQYNGRSIMVLGAEGVPCWRGCGALPWRS